jgi:hypothetical protein
MDFCTRQEFNARFMTLKDLRFHDTVLSGNFWRVGLHKKVDYLDEKAEVLKISS